MDLFVHVLVAREPRQVLAAHHIPGLALYYEDQACAAPSAARVFEILEPLATTVASHAGTPVTVTAPTLDPLQRRFLGLLCPPPNNSSHCDRLGPADCLGLPRPGERAHRSVWVSYYRRRRPIYSYALGWRAGRAMPFGYQTGGETNNGTLDADPRKRWRVKFVDEIDDVTPGRRRQQIGTPRRTRKWQSLRLLPGIVDDPQAACQKGTSKDACTRVRPKKADSCHFLGEFVATVPGPLGYPLENSEITRSSRALTLVQGPSYCPAYETSVHDTELKGGPEVRVPVRVRKSLSLAVVVAMICATSSLVTSPGASAVPLVKGTVGCPPTAPVQTLSAAYKKKIDTALASGPDILGNAALAQPGGPTYSSLKNEIAPLMYAFGPAASGSYLDDSGVYYLPFGQPTGLDGRGSIALHVADGSQIISDRSGNRSMLIYVGKDGTERYGECLPDLAQPALLDGYLPVLETSYKDFQGVDYHQESFATDIPGTGILASYVRLSATAGASNAATTEFRFTECPACGLRQDGNRLVDSGGKTYLYFSPGATYSDGSLVYHVNLAQPDKAVYIVRVNEAAVTPPLHADAATYLAALHESTTYWKTRLSQGATFNVPEPIVMNAERNLLIQNLLMTWRYSIGNAYEAFYQPESSDTVGTLGAYGFTDVYGASLDTLLPLSKGINRRNWEEGTKLEHAADYYYETHDKAFIEKNDPTYIGYAADFAAQVAADPHGLLEPQQYSSDIHHFVYGLHQIGVALKGLKAILGVWRDIGRQDLVAKYSPLASSLDSAFHAAVKASAVTLPDGSLFTPADLLDGTQPYNPITATKLGGYWNLVAWYGFASGVYPPGSPQAKATLQYAYQHGSRLLGMLRARDSAVVNVYGVEQSNFLADNDQADQLVLSLYGQLAAGMTRGTFVSGEASNIGPLATKWPLQTGYCQLGKPCTPPSPQNGWAPNEYYRAMYLPPNSADNTMFLNVLHQMLIHQVDTVTPTSDTPSGLQLAFATPRAWLAPGKTISVKDAPTAFGPLTYSIHAVGDGDVVNATVSVPPSEPTTMQLRLRVPSGASPTSVFVNGHPWGKVDSATGTIDLSGLGGTVHVTALYGHGGVGA